MSDDNTEIITIPSIQSKKKKKEKIAALTAYDFPVARILDEAGVDIVLVGDSLGMVVLGYENTIPVTMEEMIHHTKPVVRACRRALVVGDMPYFSFHLTIEESVFNASRFLKEAGARAVKIEGASGKRLKLIETMVEAEIPVMGHIGLTPQSIYRLGRYKVQGKEVEEAKNMVNDALNLEKAGVFCVVLECVPSEVSRIITEKLSIPTIGIGAGPCCDGQILVFHDLAGLSAGYAPKFVKKYLDMNKLIKEAVQDYIDDVRKEKYPGSAHSYHLKPEKIKQLFPSKAHKAKKN
ncbi:MAG: 3-methyl-2-oxobutanoate hydroxymethyltransferase [Candidatus Aminicenantes bacterium]